MMRNILSRPGLVALLVAIAIGACATGPVAALTLEPAGPPDPADPPARVGRISEIEGAVSFHVGDQDRWAPAALNYPVTGGTSLWTEPSAYAAVQLGPATARLGPQTQFDVMALDDRQVQGQIGQGAVQLRIDAVAPGEAYRIATPRGTVQIATPGRYRIDAGDTTQPTRVTVFDGAAQVVGEGLDVAVRPGETARLSGTETPTVDTAPAALEAVDQWAQAREQGAPALAAAAPRPVSPYVSPYMTGYQDLERYGSWTQTPDDGPAWTPTAVAPDWTPYRDGSWAYVAPWGWTWVDAAPWGFAPFHYGRWARLHDRWAWYPGAVVERPVYAPALVAFVGGPPPPPRRGAAVIGVGIGALAAAAWIPLGPHERYHPPYRVSERHLGGLNTGRMQDGDRRTVSQFANARATTVVPATAFARSQPVARNAVAVSPAQLASRPIAATPPALRPSPATAGASPAAIRDAGGRFDPRRASPAAPGPLAGGRPATAAQVMRAQADAAPARAAPDTAARPGLDNASRHAPENAVRSTPNSAAAPAPVNRDNRWTGRVGAPAPDHRPGAAALAPPPAAPPPARAERRHDAPLQQVARPSSPSPAPQATPRPVAPPQVAQPAPHAAPPPRPVSPPQQVARPAPPPQVARQAPAPAPHAAPPPAAHPPSPRPQEARKRGDDKDHH